VLHDVMRVLGRRFPGIPVYLAPCKVQGEGAAAQIAAAIGLLNDHGVSEVLIVGRGGGSAEDLWAFNEEPVVRAVAASAIPVISAVGHEVDVTLADLAADQRAATPSHAAELAVPERGALIQEVMDLEDRLSDAARRELARKRILLARMRLIDPGAQLARTRARAAELQARLIAASRQTVQRKRERLLPLRLTHPRVQVAAARDRAAALEGRLDRAARAVVKRDRARLWSLANELDALSPLAVLTRGYSITTLGDRAVRAASELAPGDEVGLRFSEGRARARILEIEGEP